MKEEAINRYGPVIDEMGRRPIRISKIPVINVEYHSSGKNTFVAPGTVTLYIGHKGNKLFGKVRLAAKEGGKHIEEVYEHIDRQLKNTKSVSVSDHVKMMIQEPLIADIRYAGRTLSHGFFLPHQVDLFTIP